MKTKRLLCVLLSSLAFAACSATQQGVTPGVTGASPTPGGAGHVISMGVRPKNCPGQFIYCVTVSRLQQAHLYFCYSPGSYCGGPSEYQYWWSGSFTDREGHPVKYFEDFFIPNPGDPTYDTIGELYRAKPTNGAYKYVQWVCPVQDEVCQTYAYVGIAVQ